MSVLKGDQAELKQEYNALLARFNKASAYLDGPASIEEKERWIPELQKIIARLNELVNQLGLTEEEIFNGVK